LVEGEAGRRGRRKERIWEYKGLIKVELKASWEV
jgi:hypothetical protein